MLHMSMKALINDEQPCAILNVLILREIIVYVEVYKYHKFSLPVPTCLILLPTMPLGSCRR